MTIDEYSPEEMAEFFDFLDNLWSSHTVDMLHAGPNLEEEYKMRPEDARDVLRAWRETFHINRSPIQRATTAVDSMRAD